MLEDLTELDSMGWEALKLTLNQRVVASTVRFIPGKANRVWIIETDVRPVVLKRFLTGKCGNEFESLLQARGHGLCVPMPLSVHGEYLVLEYLDGEGCDRLINHMFSMKVAEGIGEWLAKYHIAMSSGGRPKRMGDASLSNFIFSDGHVCAVDLEDSAEGDPLDDIGQAGASILGSEPFFTPIKYEVCFRMLDGYGRQAGTDVRDRSRQYVSKHLRLQARSKPLFRRTFMAAAKSIENSWPKLAH
jgi:hypothetical protein